MPRILGSPLFYCVMNTLLRMLALQQVQSLPVVKCLYDKRTQKTCSFCSYELFFVNEGSVSDLQYLY
jgi:hypothetical protein